MSDFYPATLARMRRLSIGLLLVGLTGTTVELWLMGHHEDFRQWAPLVVMACCAAGAFRLMWSWSPLATSVFRVLMVTLVLTGLVGAVLHFQANREFQLEMDPTLRGLALWGEILHAKAPPALAPGNMALLGLLGLLGAWRAEWTNPSD